MGTVYFGNCWPDAASDCVLYINSQEVARTGPSTDITANINFQAGGVLSLKDEGANSICRLISIQLPTNAHTKQPSTQPSTQPSAAPSTAPSKQPSAVPSTTPSKQPSKRPSRYPTPYPTPFPTPSPSSSPTKSPVHILLESPRVNRLGPHQANLVVCHLGKKAAAPPRILQARIRQCLRRLAQ
jgi:hypothetical protein